jgi:hypothetical protein
MKRGTKLKYFWSRKSFQSGKANLPVAGGVVTWSDDNVPGALVVRINFTTINVTTIGSGDKFSTSYCYHRVKYRGARSRVVSRYIPREWARIAGDTGAISAQSEAWITYNVALSIGAYG